MTWTLKTLPPRDGKIHVEEAPDSATGKFLVACDFTMTNWHPESQRHIMDCKMMSAEHIKKLTGVDPVRRGPRRAPMKEA